MALSIINPIYKYDPEFFFADKDLVIAQAIRAGDHKKLKQLAADHKEYIDSHGTKDVPLTLYAAMHRDWESLSILLEAGALANDTSTYLSEGEVRSSLLSLAVQSKYDSFMNYLLAHGANPDGVEGTEPPLITLVHFGGLKHDIRERNIRLNRMQRLLDSGADVNVNNEAGVSAVMEMAYTRRYEMVLLALQQGADFGYQDERGASLLTIMERWPLDINSEVGQDQQVVRDWLAEHRR
jgi:ankyrin repeat protein